MLLIKAEPNSNSTHSNQYCQSNVPILDGWLPVPAHLQETAMQYLPFVKLTIEEVQIPYSFEEHEYEEEYDENGNLVENTIINTTVKEHVFIEHRITNIEDNQEAREKKFFCR